MNFLLAEKTIGMADLQRNGRKLISQVKKSGKPHLIVSRNKPEAVLLDLKVFDKMTRELKKQKEEARMLSLLRDAEADITAGRVYRGKQVQRFLAGF